MKFSIEAKIGLIGIVTALVLIWGINYLKGRNMLNSTYTLHAFYPESAGIENSAPVLLKGVKIGYVDEVILRLEEALPIELILHIEKKYALGTGSLALLSSTDLLGSKAVRIDALQGADKLEHLDTIEGGLEKDLLSLVQDRALPGPSRTARRNR